MSESPKPAVKKAPVKRAAKSARVKQTVDIGSPTVRTEFVRGTDLGALAAAMNAGTGRVVDVSSGSYMGDAAWLVTWELP